MKDIEDFIREKVSECEKRSQYWEEKVQIIIGKQSDAEDMEQVQHYELEKQKCVGKKNELLAIADFGNELLQNYFSKTAL